MSKGRSLIIVILAAISAVALFFVVTNLNVKESNRGESIIKTCNLCNTLYNFDEKYFENDIEIPNDDGEAGRPKIEPYGGDNSTKNTVNMSSSMPKRNSGTAEVVIESTSRRALCQSNAQVKMYPASTTKVLTALCVLNNLPLDMLVTVPKEAEGVEGSSLYLKAGQRITVEDLLYGLMLRSGNDAAVTLAIATSGSVEEFARLMNETAVQCGATDSNFVNPHGLQDSNHWTTALDLALITARAYENTDFVRIVSSKTRKIVVDGEPNVIANKNKMLKLIDGANGVKTGFTKSSGRCLVSGAKRGDMQLISVVLNCGDMWNESVRLLEFGFDNYRMIPIDNALLTAGEHDVLINVKSSVDDRWRDVKYPLKRDGSERLVVSFF